MASHQQQQLPTIIFIRPYQEETDKAQVLRLIYEGTMDPVWTFFKRSLLNEIFFQAIIMTASLLFIIVGLHFYTTILVSIPLVLVLAFISIWSAHYYKAKYLHPDLENIRQNYLSSQYTNFYVAEAFYYQLPSSSSSSSNSFAFITSQAEFDRLNSGGSSGLITGSARCRQIVGTVGIVRDRDHALTSWLRRMTVKKGWRRFGIGSALVDTAIKFCSTKGFLAIGLITTECHDSGRALYESKGFEMKQFYHKKIAGLSSLAITMYFMSKDISGGSSRGRSVLES